MRWEQMVLVLGLGMSAMALSGCCNCEELGELSEGIGEVSKVVGTGLEVMKKAQSAPGTQELRDKGCDVAMAITPEMFEKFKDVLENMDDVQKDGDLPSDMALVVCTLGEGKKLSCDDAARAYIEGAKPEHKFTMTVNKPKKDDPECQKQFTPDFK